MGCVGGEQRAALRTAATACVAHASSVRRRALREVILRKC